MLNGAAYAFTAPVFGWICDKKVNPRFIGLLGNALITFSITVIGPDYVLVVLALAVHGVGLGASLVSGPSKTAWRTTSTPMDSFRASGPPRPTAGAYLKDEFGFDWSSLLVLLFAVLSLVSSSLYVLIHQYCSPSKKKGNEDGKKLIDDSSHAQDYGTLEEGSLN
ncbi:Uncharacterized protein FKW44_000749 [Caligus rogercresseyi]|uniref:Uncharacterized protein n=1 Tax=Caligus rogercresseyi TaxID=217165 RepID=A0A7T8KHS3_CALRO|nr:Uncharacterized protein FKW44_000749 [Caligus rogercresseyi]